MKFFTYSHTWLEYREIKHFKMKLFGSLLLIVAVGVGVGSRASYFLSDKMSFDDVSQTITENKLLKGEIRNLSSEIKLAQQKLEGLSERDNELRLMVDLPKLDEDTREVSIGGGALEPEFSFLGKEAGEVLSSSKSLIGKLGREIKLQQANYQEILSRYDFNKRFFAHMPAIKPAEGYYSINGFGLRIHPVLRVYRMHEGIDIITDVGTDVYATGDGVVRYAGRTQGGYGAVVEISHGYGYSSLYAHLSKILVERGQSVKRGELIAKTGRSGLVSGPHLHYEVRLNGRKLNPVDYFFDDVDAARYRIQLASVQ
jgi:murein DD-endopeptidase MepM/ murein hydrolase activator NlpD